MNVPRGSADNSSLRVCERSQSKHGFADVSIPRRSTLVKCPRVAPPSSRATIHDVAAVAGVSRGTVSRVLNSEAYVSDAAKKAVEDAIVQGRLRAQHRRAQPRHAAVAGRRTHRARAPLALSRRPQHRQHPARHQLRALGRRLPARLARDRLRARQPSRRRVPHRRLRRRRHHRLGPRPRPHREGRRARSRSRRRSSGIPSTSRASPTSASTTSAPARAITDTAARNRAHRPSG